MGSSADGWLGAEREGPDGSGSGEGVSAPALVRQSAPRQGPAAGTTHVPPRQVSPLGQSSSTSQRPEGTQRLPAQTRSSGQSASRAQRPVHSPCRHRSSGAHWLSVAQGRASSTALAHPASRNARSPRAGSQERGSTTDALSTRRASCRRSVVRARRRALARGLRNRTLPLLPPAPPRRLPSCA